MILRTSSLVKRTRPRIVIGAIPRTVGNTRRNVRSDMRNMPATSARVTKSGRPAPDA